jgi:hypothetical protein
MPGTRILRMVHGGRPGVILMDEVSTGSGSDRVRLPASSILFGPRPGRYRSRY